ncbi:MAG: hypothetical protein M1292_00780 [Bacteroidetes bacterium]|nr:hypothetical protein [Bacteroidota bacterium]
MKKRLIEFLAYLKIGQDKFEKNVGLSRGFVNKVGDSIREKNLDKISSVYPELNISWLKTGNGSMLIGNENIVGVDKKSNSSTNECPYCEDLKKENAELKRLLESKNETIQAFKLIIEERSGPRKVIKRKTG